MVHPECDLASTRARDFITNLDELHCELKQHITDAQHCYQHLADSRHSPAPEFKIGSHKFVKAQFFHNLLSASEAELKARCLNEERLA